MTLTHMTDKSPSERLRAMLDERGIEHSDTEHMTEWVDANGVRWNFFTSDDGKTDLTMETPWEGITPEQAIAATLGNDAKPCPWCGRDMQEGLRDGHTWYRDDSDYIASLKRSIDALQKAHAVLGGGKLTAEQVERIVDRNCEWYEGGEIDAQAIADELNAVIGNDGSDVDDALALLDEIREAGRITYDDYSQLHDEISVLGSGTCEWLPVESCHSFAGPGWECSSCGHEVGEYEHDFYNCCPICCAKVRKAVER